MQHAPHWLRRAPLAAALCGLLATATANAGTLQLRDSADLLTPDDESALRASGARYDFDVRVVTDTRYADRATFDRYVAAQVDGPSTLVIGVDPMHRRTAVHFGRGLRVPTTRYGAIENAGDASFRQAQWRQGIEAIALEAQSAAGTAVGDDAAAPTASQRPSFPWGMVFLAGGAVLVVAMLVRAARRRAQGYDPSAAGPYRGYEAPPSAGGGYGYGYPPQQPGSGLGAGLLGAGLGGVAGYALGHAMADRDHDAPSADTHHDAGNWDAGGGTSDWDGGGGGGDFGGGGDAGGGGGDW